MFVTARPSTFREHTVVVLVESFQDVPSGRSGVTARLDALFPGCLHEPEVTPRIRACPTKPSGVFGRDRAVPQRHEARREEMECLSGADRAERHLEPGEHRAQWLLIQVRE